MPRHRASAIVARLDVERLVVLDHANGLEGVDRAGRRLDRLEEHPEAEPLQKGARLAEILAAADREGERLQARRAHAQPPQDVVGREKDGAAVHASRKTDAERRVGWNAPEPLRDLVAEGPDVARPDHPRVGRQGVALGREVSRVGRRRVGTAHELDLDDVVRRHHPRVARVELAGEALALEELVDGVDAVGHDERGAGRLLGQEVPQGAVERPGEEHAAAVARHEGERAVDLPHRGRVPEREARAGLVEGHVVDAVLRRIGEVDDALDVRIAHGSSPCRRGRILQRPERRPPARSAGDKRSLIV